jgi:hypothetical protein
VHAERRAARLGEWRLALALESPHTTLGVDADVRREHDEQPTWWGLGLRLSVRVRVMST